MVPQIQCLIPFGISPLAWLRWIHPHTGEQSLHARLWWSTSPVDMSGGDHHVSRYAAQEGLISQMEPQMLVNDMEKPVGPICTWRVSTAESSRLTPSRQRCQDTCSWSLSQVGTSHVTTYICTLESRIRACQTRTSPQVQAHLGGNRSAAELRVDKTRGDARCRPVQKWPKRHQIWAHDPKNIRDFSSQRVLARHLGNKLIPVRPAASRTMLALPQDPPSAS